MIKSKLLSKYRQWITRSLLNNRFSLFIFTLWSHSYNNLKKNFRFSWHFVRLQTVNIFQQKKNTGLGFKNAYLNPCIRRSRDTIFRLKLSTKLPLERIWWRRSRWEQGFQFTSNWGRGFTSERRIMRGIWNDVRIERRSIFLGRFLFSIWRSILLHWTRVLWWHIERSLSQYRASRWLLHLHKP